MPLGSRGENPPLMLVMLRRSPRLDSICRFSCAALLLSASGPLALAEPAVPAKPGPSAPSSDSSQQTTTLPEVVITASRTADILPDVPFSLTVVDQSAIERRQPTTPNTMLKEQPGIWSVNVPAQGSPIIRGQIGNRVLYLWDGVRINNGSLFGGPNGYFNQFPLDAVDRIEVLRGAGSVQYGSDAVGGVINILQKRGEFSDKLEAGGDLYGRYGTNNEENTEAFNVHLSDQRFALVGGMTRQDVGDYHGPNGAVSPSGFNALGGYVNLAVRPARDQTIRLSFIENERTDVDSYVQSKLNPSGVPRIFNPVERRGILKLDYSIENLGVLSSELKLYGYYEFYDQLRERRTESATAFSTTTTDTSQNVLGAGIQNTTKFDRLRFVYGVDYRHEELDSSLHLRSINLPTGHVTDSEPAGNTPDGTYDVLSAFLSSEFRPVEALLLTAGVRFENTHLRSTSKPLDVIPNAGYTLEDLDVDKSWNSVVWNVGSIVSVTRHWDVVANIGTGFRAPTYADLLSAGTPVFSSRIASVPSPNLDPEKSLTFELGPRVHSTHFSGSLTGYYTKLTDLVMQVSSGTVDIPGQGTFIATHNSNAGKGYVTGAELALAFQPTPQWTFFANATYTYGQNQSTDTPLRFIPPLNGAFGIRYESPSGRWWVEAAEVWAARLTRHAPDDEQDAGFSRDPAYGSPNTTTNPPLRDNFDIPGFWVTNIRGGVKVWERQGRSLALTVDLNNIFNKSYREAYSQQQLEAPGFGAVFGARLTF